MQYGTNETWAAEALQAPASAQRTFSRLPIVHCDNYYFDCIPHLTRLHNLTHVCNLRARVLDERKAAELELTKKLCLLPNRHNTDEYCYMNNGRRAIARLKKTVTVKAKDKKPLDINDQIASLRATLKDLTQQKQGIRNGSSACPIPGFESVHYSTDLHTPPPPPLTNMAELSVARFLTLAPFQIQQISPALCFPSSFGGPMLNMSDIYAILFPSSTAPSSIP
ncbi:hypothetical protein M422DRAFT_256396 [Sphaerobolus stellatus SS14]|uniref:Uncharacterized protein n=1 Tax=Sphaerobolus stellatus (strain SS14) TaxID=990650 RepID=A0A0C9VRS7_SPHS4|nr:hypothetical protein M422DRAFT_256396 [Sphaerobolus stellatus SS14]